jgi:hypothetical protein
LQIAVNTVMTWDVERCMVCDGSCNTSFPLKDTFSKLINLSNSAQQGKMTPGANTPLGHAKTFPTQDLLRLVPSTTGNALSKRLQQVEHVPRQTTVCVCACVLA